MDPVLTCDFIPSVVVTIGQLLVMASMAEYCSIWPTAGGQQFYAQVYITLPHRLDE